MIKVAESIKKSSDFDKIGKRRKLRTFDSNGKIYFPKFIRELFKDCYFTIEVSEGKITLDPVKLDDVFDGEVDE